MKRWNVALLLFELFLFALILILPQVDLPDFTFHGGTAPVVAKARFSSPPVRGQIASFTRTHSFSSSPEEVSSSQNATVAPDLTCQLDRLCTLLC